MIEPQVVPNETDRLAALRDLDILDTPPEDRFDRITRLAQKIFDVPIALVSLIDANRQWFKSCQGLDVSQTPRGISFCGHAILSHDVFVIEDAAADARFADNPLVTGGPLIRFYAGAPLKLRDGHAAGTLCIISPMPRKFGPHDQAVLQELAATAIAELEDVHTAARERELRDFIDTAGTLIQSVDETGRVRMINRAWTAAVGYSTAEALGKNIFDIIDPAEQEHWRATLAKLLASDLPCALETNFMTKDGRKLRVTGVLNTLKRPDGTHAIRGVFQDVTAQRELERIRSEITHHVSHELKTPLTVTTVALHMMEESNHELSAEQSQLLGTALKGVSHLSRMVDDLMDASRSDSGKMRLDVAPNDLNPFLTNIDNAFNPLATRNGMALTVEHVDPKIRAMFDPVRLRQILSNLIVNAMKFSPKGGHITIGTKEGPEGSIEIFVRDTGIGIKIGDLDRIFDRLYQTSNKVQKGETGLGLGLHICRELVLVHGGRIWVTSNLGEGTTFHFTLLLA